MEIVEQYGPYNPDTQPVCFMLEADEHQIQHILDALCYEHNNRIMRDIDDPNKEPRGAEEEKRIRVLSATIDNLNRQLETRDGHLVWSPPSYVDK